MSDDLGFGNADLRWEAIIDDKTGQFFDTFDKNVQRAENTASRGFGSIGEAIRGSGLELGVVGGFVAGLTSKFVQFGMQAVAQIKNFVAASIDLSARVGTLGVAMNTVGANAGYSAEEMAKFEEDTKAMGITTQVARTNLLRMAQANLDLTRTSELARVAQDAAVIAGVNSSQAFERMLHGITTLQPEILRGLGIVVDFQGEYEKFAATTGLAAKDIDTAVKQQIAMNAVISAGTRIAGSYESAMGTVGKQMTSLPRYIEEVQLKLGELFQPMQSEKIGFMTEKLKELYSWLEENGDQIQEVSIRIGELAGIAFEFLGDFIDSIVKIPSMIEDVGISIAKMIANAFDAATPEEIERRSTMLGTYFGQAMTIISTIVTASIAGLLEVISTGIDGYKAIFALLEGDADKAAELWNSALERTRILPQTVNEQFNDLFVAFGEAFGVIEKTAEATDDVGDAMQEAVQDTAALDAEISKLTQSLEKMIDSMKEEAAQALIKDMRQQIEDELNLSHKIEDIERRHVERLQQIQKRLESDRAKAAEDMLANEVELYRRHSEDIVDLDIDSAQSRVDIEENYQRTLNDLRRRFEYDAEELVRTRDAVGLLRLKRQYEQERDEARVNKDNQLSDESKNRERRMQDLQRSLQREREEIRRDLAERLEELDKSVVEQLATAEDARETEYENLSRALEREAELKALRRMWDEEDRRSAQRRELAELGQHFATIEGSTAAHLLALMNQYDDYFKDIDALMEGYYGQVQQSQFSKYNPLNPGTWFSKPAEGPKPAGVVGQAGLVSQMLARVPSIADATPRVPAVQPQSSRTSRDVRVTVDGAGLDPYIQRQVATAIMEIERNG